MIPLALVTGFLGSGKTTLLRRLVERYRDRTIAYLVNEFSHVDVDGRRLAETAPNVRMLPGGSIFCSCLVHEFIAALELAPKQVQGTLDGVIIEASGVASPAVIAQLLRDTRLDQLYSLTTVLSIVDPGTFPVLLQSLPNIAAQVAASDLVLVNKSDLFDEARLRETETQVRGINGGALIRRTVFCNMDFDLLQPLRPPCACGLSGALAPCRDPNYVQFDVTVAAPVDLKWLEREMNGLRDELYRAKGHVLTPEGAYYVDYTASGLTVERATGPEPTPDLVFIAKGQSHDRTSTLVRRLETGRMPE